MTKDPEKIKRINPWLVILLTAAIPIGFFLFYFAKWVEQKTDIARVTSEFGQRQNSVLAYNAMEVSSSFTELLEKGARDAKVLSLVPPTVTNFQEFHKAQVGNYTQFFSEAEPPKQISLPFYNREIFLSGSGAFTIFLLNGKPESHPKNIGECSEKNLCDASLLKKALTMPAGSIWYGDLMRYYAGEGEREQDDTASLNVVYRSSEGVVLLGIDYRHLRDHLTTPVFPYDRKRNLLASYRNGNYIYFVNSTNDIIVHPKYWHVAGIDKKTGKRVPPMVSDSDEGRHPLNIGAYENGKLKDYFRRLLTQSFTQRGVDIFQAPNLSGKVRVLSVAPVFASRGQFEKSGIFGHVILGCSLDHFEEPSEKLVPYY